MFDIGFWELTVIAVIGLIVLGPERLPVVARTLGTWVGRAKGYVRGLTSELEREANVGDIRSEVRRVRQQIESESHDTVSSLREPLAPETARSGPKIDADGDDDAVVPDGANPVGDALAREHEHEPADDQDRRA